MELEDGFNREIGIIWISRYLFAATLFPDLGNSNLSGAGVV